jgi:hypothetical protein
MAWFKSPIPVRDYQKLLNGKNCYSSRKVLSPLPPPARVAAAYVGAREIAEEDIAINQGIGQHGPAVIRNDQGRQEAGRARQRADALQRRLVRNGCMGGLALDGNEKDTYAEVAFLVVLGGIPWRPWSTRARRFVSASSN